MIGEIIAIGNELTSGRVLNTTSRYAAGMLFGAGHEIIAMSTIGDTPAEIGKTLLRAIKRAEFVIVTGGLGATSDDLTSEVVGQTLDKPAVFHPEVFEKIRLRMDHADEQAISTMKKLAVLPKGAELLSPEAKMAGFLLVHDSKPIFFLPGIPHEMKELLAEKVIPRLDVWQDAAARTVRQRVYKVFGLGETEINRSIFHLEKEEEGVRIGYYPVFPEVHVSLTVIDEDTHTGDGKFRALDREITAALGDNGFGTDEDTMESVVGDLLKKQQKKLATAESCSGGLISRRITSVAGSSDYFIGGVVAYSNGLKQKFLGVEPDLLAEHGAVSSVVAQAMAEGIRSQCSADIGLAVTGIAGPTGGTPEKPLGTVYIGLADRDKTLFRHCLFSGDRRQVQELSAAAALDIVRRLLLGKDIKHFKIIRKVT